MKDSNHAVGTLGWIDLTVPEAEAIRDFYSAVIGWGPSGVDVDAGYQDYNMLPPGALEPAAAVCHARGANADLPPVWIPYFYVADLDAAIAACRAHGGTFVRRPPEPGTAAEHPFAFVRDPAGAVVALWQHHPETQCSKFKGAFPISGDVKNVPVRELAPAIAFYTRLLGFHVVSREGESAVLRRDDAEIGLACNQDDPEQVSVYFSVENLEALHRELTLADLEPTTIRPDEHDGKPYRVCFAKEPYGVCFCFGEPASA